MSDTEQEIYDSAVEQTQNVPETPTEAPTEAKPERARDEHGRFAKAVTEQPSEVVPVAEPTAPVETHEDARVPSWRLKEESDRRREAESALNQLRDEVRSMQMHMMQMRQPQAPIEPQEAPDIFADPQGFVAQLQGNFDQRLRTLQLENSLRFAHYTHKEKFDEAYSAFTDYISKTRDQASYQRVMASSDPGEALVQWHKDQTLQRELGGSDLNSFLAKRQEEWLKDPAVQAKVIEAFKATQQAQTPNNLINTPPSLSRAPSAASAHDDGGSSPQDIYNYATRR